MLNVKFSSLKGSYPIKPCVCNTFLSNLRRFFTAGSVLGRALVIQKRSSEGLRVTIVLTNLETL